MKLDELIGKKVVRVESVFEYIDEEIGAVEDDSFRDSKGEYIEVLEKTEEGILFYQFFGGRVGENMLRFKHKYDKLFLDDKWKEWNV